MKKVIIIITAFLFLFNGYIFSDDLDREDLIRMFFSDDIHLVPHIGYHQKLQGNIGGNIAFGGEIVKRFDYNFSFTFGMYLSPKYYKGEVSTTDGLTTTQYNHKIYHYPLFATLGYHWHIMKTSIHPYLRIGAAYNFISVKYDSQVGANEEYPISPEDDGFYEGWGYKAALGANIKLSERIKLALESNYISSRISKGGLANYRYVNLSGLFFWGGVNVKIN